jgi:AhpD family alkylhydroperoxidase
VPRVAAVPPQGAGLLGRLVYRLASRRYGQVPEPLAVARQHPGVFAARCCTRACSLRDLVVHRVATVLGCSWCVDFGAVLMRLSGLDTERLSEIDHYATSSAFDATEKLALAYADAMTATPVTVTDDQVEQLQRLLGADGVVELTYLIALENLRARSNSALGIVDQGFSASCAAPAAAS